MRRWRRSTACVGNMVPPAGLACGAHKYSQKRCLRKNRCLCNCHSTRLLCKTVPAVLARFCILNAISSIYKNAEFGENAQTATICTRKQRRRRRPATKEHLLFFVGGCFCGGCFWMRKKIWCAVGAALPPAAGIWCLRQV